MMCRLHRTLLAQAVETQDFCHLVGQSVSTGLANGYDINAIKIEILCCSISNLM